MADRIQKRIAVKIEPPKSELFTELPSVSDAQKITVATEARLGTDIPDAPNQSAVVLGIPNAVLGYDIPTAPDANVLRIEAQALLDATLADAPSSSVSVFLPPLPDISSELASASDTARIQIPIPSPELTANIADAPSAITSVILPALPELSTVVPDTTDAVKITTVPPLPVLSPELADAPSASITALSPQLPILSPELADAPEMRRVQTPIPSPELQVELSDAPTREITHIAPPIPAFPSLDSIPDPGEIGQEKAREFSFNGEWKPSEDPLNIQPQDFAVLKNFRYKDDGIEGVGGSSRINTTPMGKQIRSAIQLKTNYSSQPSIILAQGVEDGGTGGVIATNEGTIPTTTNAEMSVRAFAITSGNTRLDFLVSNGTSSGTANINLVVGEYSTGTEFAAYLESIMNTNITIVTIVGAVVSVTYSTTAYTFTINVSSPPNTIKYVHATSTAGASFGFAADDGPAWAIVGDPIDNDSPLYSETSGHSLARFSLLPQGNVGMCDGKANKIWAGDERPVDAFLTGTEPTVAIVGNDDRLDFTSSVDGAVHIHITVGTYSMTELVDEISDRLNEVLSTQNATVTNRLGKIHIAVNTGTIKYTYYSVAGYAGETCGFLSDTGAMLEIESQTYYAGAPYFKNIADFTDIIKSNSSGVTVSSLTARTFFLVGSTRPILNFNFTISSSNSPTLLTTYYFNGTNFTGNTEVSDGTSNLASTGVLKLTDTTSYVQPILINGYYLYFYYFTLDTGTTTIKNITLNCPISDIVDLWSAETLTARKIILVNDGEKKDYTLDLAENTPRAYKDDGTSSNVGVMPLAAMGGATEYIELLFAYPMCGFIWYLANSDLTDPAPTTTAEKMIVSYWDGDSYVEATNIYDSLKNSNQVDIDGGAGTKWTNYYLCNGGGYQFFKVGTDETKSEIDNIKGYRYKISWDDDFNNVTVDRISGVQRYRTLYDKYTFPFQYRNRAMWCGCISDKELNRVDYSMQNAPDVYNGEDSSKYDNSYSLKFGDKTALTGAVELFNDYGLNLASGALFFKNTQTFLLTGSTPTGDDAFKINKISGQTGCPAPLTITPAEVSFTTGDQPPANIVLWMTDKGPVMYYGTSIYVIPGMEYFFRQENTTICLDLDYVSRAAAWYDSQYREWNLVFPSKSAVTNMGTAGLCDTWIVYDLVRRKWYQRVTDNWDDFPQGGFQVEDTNGNKYVYCYTKSGYLLRMENGLYDGDGSTGITNTVKTADILPLQTMWAKTYVRRMKILHVDNALGQLAITHFIDGATSATDTVMSAVASNMDGLNRYVNTIKQVYGSSNQMLTGLSHAFQLQITNSTGVKPKLLGWGAQFLFDREDIS